MQRFTNAIRESVAQQNWYAALTTALILPDICGKMINPKAQSGARYAAWFDEWLGPHYRMGPGGHVFLSGSDCYALRCSLLHQGDGDITGRKGRAIRNALNNFHFITPPPGGGMVHCNQNHNLLQLQVDIFALQMADAASDWARSVEKNEAIQQRLRGLLVIHDSAKGITF